ncbi:hypothetical protein [Kitasatospora sp. NPDC085879]|uniref:hypothetical protein n=1 Tax=Kitasatospora sp. NPDC085879 TaxID=3154769 RepID=UPI0034199810
MSSNTPWFELWQGYEERTPRTALGDLAREVRCYEGGRTRGPDDAISLAVTGAEAAQATVDALYHEWALYTPQQASVLAAALFAQVDAVGIALQRLCTVLAEIESRGDCAPVAPVCGLIEAAADHVLFVVPFYADAVVDELTALRSALTLPSGPHDTIAAVAEILGVELDQRHGPGEQGDDGEGCGCGINLTMNGRLAEFARGDSRWYLSVRDGRDQPDGTVRSAGSVDLDLTDPRAHPEHLAAELRTLLQAVAGSIL